MTPRLLSLLAVLTITTIALAQDPAPKPLKIVDSLMKGNSSTRPTTVKVDHVMLHFCSDVIQNPDHPYDVERMKQIFANAPASANYLIDRDGTVHRLVPEDRSAWHAGKGTLPWDKTLKSLNERGIGIEMFAVGSENDMRLFGIKPEQYAKFKHDHPDWVGYTDAQYASLNELLAGIRQRHPQIKMDRYHIVGHEEWAGRSRRTDPGELFDWTRIGLTRERPTTQPTHD
jgi:N-acetyl-anhydromuramyl-L-alanine amidase AmpD